MHLEIMPGQVETAQTECPI